MGRKLTSKTNGNSIFIPASGCRKVSEFYYQDIYAYVWSSSHFVTQANRAHRTHIDNRLFDIISYTINNGMVIRPVSE